MIINGNYKFIDIDSLKPRLIETFTRYYGEEFRDEITDKINKMEYKPYHTIDYVCDYYNQYINVTHREDLANIFFELISRERTPELESVIMPITYDNNPEIYFAVCGGYDLSNYITLTDQGVDFIYNLREKIKNAFGFEGNDYEVFEQINELYKKYIEAEKEVGRRFPCDVVKDVEKFSQNSIDCMREFLKNVKDIGYDVAFEDIALVTKDTYTPNDAPLLRASKLLFGNEIMEKGTIASFTSENNNLLKTGTISDKVDIITDRLRYLSAFNVKFKYIDKEELYEPTDSDTFVDRLFNEYEYQKGMPDELTHIDYFNYDLEAIKKNFKKGEFFPTELADKIEEYRYMAVQDIVTDCKFYEHREPYPADFQMEYFTIYDYINRNIYKPFSAVYINEDYTLNTEDFLLILLHEINHVMGHGLPFSIDEKNSIFTSKEGLNHIVKYKDEKDRVSFEHPSPIYLDSTIQKLEENVNERQGKEMLEILLEEDIDLGFEEDTIYKGEKDDYSCAYTRYDFLIDDFYEMFYDAIRQNKINSSYQFYFKHDLATTKVDKIISHIKNKINRITSHSYSEEGVVDFYKVERLAKLIDEFYEKVSPLCEMKARELGRKLTEEDLDDNIIAEIKKLEVKRDKILKEMITDIRRIKSPNQYVNVIPEELTK